MKRGPQQTTHLLELLGEEYKLQFQRVLCRTVTARSQCGESYSGVQVRGYKQETWVAVYRMPRGRASQGPSQSLQLDSPHYMASSLHCY
jgi:hypothetical protein